MTVEVINRTVADSGDIISPTKVSSFFGDGSDGDVTISGNTNITRDMYYRNLTLTFGANLRNTATTSPTTNAGSFRIFVLGTLTMYENTSINSDGLVGLTPAPGSTAAGFVASAIRGTLGWGTNGNGGGNGAVTGVAGTAGTSLNGTNVDARAAVGGAGAAGGSGGNGLNGNGGVGGAGGTITLQRYIRYLTVDSSYRDTTLGAETFYLGGGVGGGGGGGGGGHTVNGAGGGGGGGGAGAAPLFLAAANIQMSYNARISSNGGAGGAGTVPSGGTLTGRACGGGGGGGGGGWVYIIYKTWNLSDTTLPLVTANGGAGGLGGTNGVQTPGNAGSVGSSGLVQVFNLNDDIIRYGTGTVSA